MSEVGVMSEVKCQMSEAGQNEEGWKTSVLPLGLGWWKGIYHLRALSLIQPPEGRKDQSLGHRPKKKVINSYFQPEGMTQITCRPCHTIERPKVMKTLFYGKCLTGYPKSDPVPHRETWDF